MSQALPVKKKICVICPNPQGYAPGQRLKYEQYFKSWEAAGYSIDVFPFFSESMHHIVYKKGYFFKKVFGTIAAYARRTALLFKIRQYDLVYIFLWVTPFGLPIYEGLVSSLAKKLIYDIDDLVFLTNPGANKIIARLKGKSKPRFLIKRADHVITCTPFLDAYARKYNSRTTDISSTINTDTYVPVNTYDNNDELVLGWSGSHSTIRYLYLLKDALLELQTKLPFKLMVMGDDQFDIPGLKVETRPWKESYEVATLQQYDIGLYPLPLNETWVLGKSGLKALQYMALGIPTVATNVGCNDRVIENGVSGMLVTTQDDWVNALYTLASDTALRKSMGLAARQRVEKLYSIKANTPVYLSIIQKVLAN